MRSNKATTKGFITRKLVRLQTEKNWLKMKVRNIDIEIAGLLADVAQLNRARMRCQGRIDSIGSDMANLEPRLKGEEVKVAKVLANYPNVALSAEDVASMI